MHSLEPSRPADFRERFLPTQTTVSGNTGPKRTTSLPSISPAPPQPPSATVVAGNFYETGRVRQHQELGRSVKETSEGSKP
ncbi:DNAse I-like superfamily protein [Prunus dulcis]|uniref:DNAse I-like superfamily protein n=1 Tax=Prunus dulcis TaxID=3755 RepID=A0A4Y1QWM2_PRUDU|nr:DNAse I-like superfamily protein [Prunus dulcis]